MITWNCTYLADDIINLCAACNVCVHSLDYFKDHKVEQFERNVRYIYLKKKKKKKKRYIYLVYNSRIAELPKHPKIPTNVRRMHVN